MICRSAGARISFAFRSLLTRIALKDYTPAGLDKTPTKLERRKTEWCRLEAIYAVRRSRSRVINRLL